MEWHLDKPFWSSAQGNGMRFDLRPIDVLANPQEHSYHWNRIEQADTTYPICVTKFLGHEIIIDGIHRLAWFAARKVAIVDIKLVSENELQKIATRT